MGKKAMVRVVCAKCGKEAPVDAEKSNANWTVCKSTCDGCGAEDMKFEEVDHG